MAIQLSTDTPKNSPPRGTKHPAKKPFDWQALLESEYVQGKVSVKDRMFFTEQLALLLDTGINIHGALQAIANQLGKGPLKKLVDSLSREVSEGKSFSQALAKHPKVFSATYVNLIAASEQGGFTVKVLEELHDYDERRTEMKHTLFASFSYPAFLILFSLLVVVLVLIKLFPVFAEMFEEIRDELPPTTILFLEASDLLTQHGQWILIGAMGLMLTLVVSVQAPSGKRALDKIVFKMPVLKGLVAKLYLVQVTQVLSLSLSNGVNLLDSLIASRDTVNNHLYVAFLSEVEERLREGRSFTRSFEHPQFIPKVVNQMAMAGEESGNLGKVLGKLSSYYQKDMQRKLQSTAKAMEPIMLMFMGVLVGLIVSSLILPIFKLSSAVG